MIKQIPPVIPPFGPAALTATRTTTLTVSGSIAALTTLSTTGSGANYTWYGDSGNIGASAGVFAAAEAIQVFQNGVLLEKGTNVIWMTATSFRVSTALDSGDIITILS